VKTPHPAAAAIWFKVGFWVDEEGIRITAWSPLQRNLADRFVTYLPSDSVGRPICPVPQT
jgi:hypothetical protein